MKVCLIGEFSPRRDEGYRNVIQNLSEGLDGMVDTTTINTRQPRLGELVREVREFRPDIIHYFSAPTLSSLALTRLARASSGTGARTVVSSLHPNGFKMIGNPATRALASLMRPDLVLTQNARYDRALNALGYRTLPFPNGVDADLFRPVGPEEKMALRAKYGLDPNKRIVLHVGHIVESRGLRSLVRVMGAHRNVQALVIGSTYFRLDSDLLRDLEGGECLIWRQYFDHIEELYQLSDVYAFPVETTESLFMPLSIIEAMSCNLPVVTTRFESIEQAFGRCRGLYIASGEDDFVALIGQALAEERWDTRSPVIRHTWSSLSAQLVGIYHQLLGGGG